MKQLKQIFADDSLLTKVKCLSNEQMLRMSQGLDIGEDFVFQKMRIELKSITGYWESSIDEKCTNVMVDGKLFIVQTGFVTMEKRILKFKRSMKFLEIIHN